MDWHQVIAHDQTAHREQDYGTGRDEGFNVIEVEDDVYWIGRLPLTDYYVERRPDGGESSICWRRRG